MSERKKRRRKGDENILRLLFRSDWKCLSPHRSMIQACLASSLPSPSLLLLLLLPFFQSPEFFPYSEKLFSLENVSISRRKKLVNSLSISLCLSLSFFLSFSFSVYWGFLLKAGDENVKGGRTRIKWKQKSGKRLWMFEPD